MQAKNKTEMGKISEVRYIIVHCTATPEGRDVTASEVDRWHRQRGFAGIGYHYVVRLDGTVERGRAEESVGAHCQGRNGCSIGVCYVGGVARDGRTPKDTRTRAQREALTRLLRDLKSRYPSAAIRGHRDFAAKACPSFDATAEYGVLGLAAVGPVLLPACSSHREATTASAADIETGRRADVGLEALTRVSDSLELRIYRPRIEMDTARAATADSVVLRRVGKARTGGTLTVRQTDTLSVGTVDTVHVVERSESGAPKSGYAVGLLVLTAALCMVVRKMSAR